MTAPGFCCSWMKTMNRLSFMVVLVLRLDGLGLKIVHKLNCWNKSNRGQFELISDMMVGFTGDQGVSSGWLTVIPSTGRSS